MTDDVPPGPACLIGWRHEGSERPAVRVVRGAGEAGFGGRSAPAVLHQDPPGVRLQGPPGPQTHRDRRGGGAGRCWRGRFVHGRCVGSPFVHGRCARTPVGFVGSVRGRNRRAAPGAGATTACHVAERPPPAPATSRQQLPYARRGAPVPPLTGPSAHPAEERRSAAHRAAQSVGRGRQPSPCSRLVCPPRPVRTRQRSRLRVPCDRCRSVRLPLTAR
ncbi:MAG: hypothetical protein JWO67_1503 [Streptosporangiaceae bacterium]|nr:hypothetical protein [Streptosporangiaceae bacterium]